jgi:outer membrane protein assembly factor BamB
MTCKQSDILRFTVGLMVLLLANVPLSVAAFDEIDAPTRADYNWPHWRGPLATGVAPHGDPPTSWSESKNVRWKTPLAGQGHSSPIVWGEWIFVTSAEPFGSRLKMPQPDTAPGAHDNLLIDSQYRFFVIALDRATGDIKWKKQLAEALPHEGGHFSASLASNSPVTDGTHLVACFGSRGLYCLNFDGQLLWKKNPGNLRTKHGHGEGASPLLHDGIVVVNRDHEGQSSIAARRVETGELLWKQDRNEVTSWSSPIVVEHGNRAQVIVAGTQFVRAYDLETGDIVWQCGGLSANVVASPVAANGFVVVGSSYDTRAMFAIRLAGAAGDITGSENVLWQKKQRTPYVPSPLLHEGKVYFLRHYQGILSRVDVQTGAEPVGPFRLGALRDIYASPVCANDRIYFTDLDGMTMVVQHGETPQPLATNRLNDSFSASAAIVGDAIYLRGKKSLYCLAEEVSPTKVE